MQRELTYEQELDQLTESISNDGVLIKFN